MLFIGVFSMSSCKKEILNYPDPNSKNEQSFFNTPQQIEQAAFATYNAFFHNSIYTWKYTEMFDALANELEGRPSSAGEGNVQTIWRYTHNNSTDIFQWYWRLLYRMIMRANLVIYKSEQYVAENSADPIVSRSMGDAYFLRGWAYSQLAFYWGSVPVRNSYVMEGNGDMARAPVETVWAQAEADLKQAQTLLPETWDAAFLGRATKGAATGFLGKLYLNREKYGEAEAEFEKMDGKYSLLPGSAWDDNFGETNENNQESVFEIQCYHYPGSNSGASMFGDPEEAGNPGRQNGRPQLYSWQDWANWSFQPRRVTDFQYADESGDPYVDPRAPLTFYGGIGDQTYCDNCAGGAIPYDFATRGYWYRKGTNKENKPNESGIQTGNNIRLMRYADVLLMRAECQIKEGNITAGLALINQVRARIGAFQYVGTYNETQAFELLKRERQLELMGEQVRYGDLKRWKILKETMNVELQATFGTPNVEDKHYLFPIPQLELDTNREFGTVSNSWN